jgi:hypothetical protein
MLRMQYIPVTQIEKKIFPFLREHTGLEDRHLQAGLMRNISIAILSIVIHNYGTDSCFL